MAKTKKVNSIQQEAWEEAIAIVNQERTNWEEAVTYVTEKVAFRMRELIRVMRKNYWGVFDEPIDKQTGREKIWIGLIMSTIEDWVKNIDLDTKDIGFIARTPQGQEITQITRMVVKDYLDRAFFGETLDADERQVLIDGTVVWKTWESRVNGKVKLNRRTTDLLNFYIDPTEENIQTAFRVTERAIMLPVALQAMSGWVNTDGLTGSQILNKSDGNRRANFGTKTTGDFRDVWETWGKVPRWIITLDKKADDAYELIDGHIVVSGFEAPETKCHLIEENKRKDKFGNSIKPYEEWRPCKISGRWYGLGIAERLLALQEYLNIVFNIRVTRNYVSQLGLFKIKKGKGITPQMLSKLPVNGAIQVQDMDDIQQMPVSEIGQSSYNDEEVIKYWARQIASNQAVTSGEIMPASATATSSAIANTNAKSAFTLFKESTGLFLTRWLDRQALPIIAKTVTKGEIFRLNGDDNDFDELVETIAINKVSEDLDKNPIVPSAQELEQAVTDEEERLKKTGTVFIESVQDIIAESLDTKVHITNEDLDTSVTIANLLQLMAIPPELRDDASVEQIYDLMGLRKPKPKKPTGMPMNGEMPPEQTIPTQTGIMTSSLLKGQVA